LRMRASPCSSSSCKSWHRRWPSPAADGSRRRCGRREATRRRVRCTAWFRCSLLGRRMQTRAGQSRLPNPACPIPLAQSRLRIPACPIPLAQCRLRIPSCPIPLAQCRLHNPACAFPLAQSRLRSPACPILGCLCRFGTSVAPSPVWQTIEPATANPGNRLQPRRAARGPPADARMHLFGKTRLHRQSAEAQENEQPCDTTTRGAVCALPCSCANGLPCRQLRGLGRKRSRVRSRRGRRVPAAARMPHCGRRP
jgi:hypothetical protein